MARSQTTHSHVEYHPVSAGARLGRRGVERGRSAPLSVLTTPHRDPAPRAGAASRLRPTPGRPTPAPRTGPRSRRAALTASG